jgi:hypothetical protein
MPLTRTRRPDRKPVYAYTIVITSKDAGLNLNACVYNIQAGPTRPMARWDAVEVKP